jgi:hypothetical protein
LFTEARSRGVLKFVPGFSQESPEPYFGCFQFRMNTRGTTSRLDTPLKSWRSFLVKTPLRKTPDE